MKTVDNHTHTELLLKIRPRNRISQNEMKNSVLFFFCFRSHFWFFFFFSFFVCVTRISWHTAPFFLHHSLNNNGKYAESLQTHVTAKQEKKKKKKRIKIKIRKIVSQKMNIITSERYKKRGGAWMTNYTQKKKRNRTQIQRRHTARSSNLHIERDKRQSRE